MSSNKARKRARGRPQRFTSNVFSMFTDAQMNEFKEAFSTIDTDKDGLIERSDLKSVYTSLGKSPTDAELDEMLAEANNSVNFTMFLTIFGQKMQGCDPESSILDAFVCFDPDNTGQINEDRLRELMTTMGDRWSHEKVDELFYGAPIQNSNFDYKEFTRTIVHGQDDEEEEEA